MMSILIKGMEMPKSCEKCKFSWWDVGNFYCEADGKPWGLEVTGCTEKRHPDCPLIEVPEDVQPVKHGRWDGYGRCTACGMFWDEMRTMDGDDTGYWYEMPPYCNNCGAKMDGEE